MATESSIEQLRIKDPDIRLMVQVQNDDATAFEELMLRYQGRVISLLTHVIGNRDQAEDLTQEVFLRVYRARKSYMPEAKFSTWLFTIANNIALNAIRTKKRHPELQMPNSSDSSSGMPTMENSIPAKSAVMPTRQLDKLEVQEAVRLAIASLGENQRIAVMLNRFEGMNYNDIARVMQLTPQAVKSLLCRARNNLRAVLGPYVEHGKQVAGHQNGSEKT
ncbi:MAG: sigma-70 family RNA polymerase sigma factor [Planctomycetaceae bacterium]|nr:sigma-70 family RNA polymerase sigma factor [Planctomycetaceae bacterium]